MSDSKNQNEQRHCNYCQTDHPWIFSGLKLKDGSKIYVDDNGSRWAGKRCPKCEKKRVQAAVKYDQFERRNIKESLENSGYEIINTGSPIVIEKDGHRQSVAIRRAYTKEDGKIVIEPPTNSEKNADVTALLFQTVKLCNSEQMARLEDKFEIFKKSDERSRKKRKVVKTSELI